MKRFFKLFDYFLFTMVLSLAIFGIIVIGSATHIQNGADPSIYNSQKVWVLLGIISMIIVSCIDYHLIGSFYWVIYGINVFLLTLVLILGKINGSTVSRWIYIGGASMQPSEFSKIFTIIFLSAWIDKKQSDMDDFKQILIICIVSSVPIILIMMEPSLSASMVTIFITVVLIFAGGINYKYVYRTLLIMIPVGILFLIDILRETHIFVDKILQDYQIERIRDSIIRNPDSASRYQTNYSVSAIASGQLKGEGLYNGTLTQLNFIPEAQNDFIFAVIGEAFGFIGCVIVISVLLAIILRCINTAKKSSDMLGKLMATGVACFLAFQVFINIGVATDILPNTGMALPFISYGGSAMLIDMTCIGLVINIRMNEKKSMFED